LEMSVEQILNVLLSRIEAISAGIEDVRFKVNVLGTAMVDSEQIKKDDVRQAVRKQMNVMKYLGSTENVESDTVEQLTESLMNWFNGDMSAIKSELETYRKMAEEAQKKEGNEQQRIQIAGPDSLGDLKNQNNRR